MSCHYSCSSCSAATYMFKCLSCPSTRSFLDSTCLCKDGYYERQEQNCYTSSCRLLHYIRSRCHHSNDSSCCDLVLLRFFVDILVVCYLALL